MALEQGSVGDLGAKVASGTQTGTYGFSGERYVAPIHDPRYAAARAGRLFTLATAAAGVTIPAQATNVVSTFTLLNPRTSAMNLALHRVGMGVLVAANQVVSDLSLYYQTDIGGANTALATTTALAIRNRSLGHASSGSALGYSAATFANVIGTNMFRLNNLFSFTGTTALQAVSLTRELEDIIVPPGAAVTILASVLQTNALTFDLTFSEWPV